MMQRPSLSDPALIYPLSFTAIAASLGCSKLRLTQRSRSLVPEEIYFASTQCGQFKLSTMANQTAPGREPQLGWVNSPNQRGTIDIIWSCLLVLFTGTWSVLHVNLPAEGEGYWSIIIRKARWFIFAIGSPEVITILASTQRMSARYSVPKMHSIGVSHWTPVHGFFADSGGFVLHPPDTPSFPFNSRALHYLIEKKYLEPPSLTKQDIWDRSKFDRFAKAVAIVQSMYMICSCISRAAQSLAITVFELFTLAFVVCTATSFYFWMDKPLGVESAVHLRLTTPMATILTEAGPAAGQPYVDTPMDFVEQPGWRVFSRVPLFTSFGGIEKRPLKRYSQ
jgi:hypothetical protein